MTPPRTPTRAKWIGPTLVAVALFAAGCADAPQDTFDARGRFAEFPLQLILWVFLVAAVVFVIVEGLILYASVKFRARSADERPEQIHGNAKLEITWAVIPAVILLVIGFATIGQLFELDDEQPNPVRIEVVGHQWWWEYRYMDQADPTKVVAITANELRIPVKRNIRLDLTSADVTHNFWPPKLAGKVYAIPGRHNKMYLNADDLGEYYGECAEYCGLSHANMRLRVFAQTQADFDAWLARESVDRPAPAPGPTDTSAVAGARIFLEKGCSGCHTVQGASIGNVGPDLTHFNARSCFAGCIFANNDENLRRWLRDPTGEKPGSLMPDLDLTEQDVTDLTAYLKTLGDASTRPDQAVLATSRR